MGTRSLIARPSQGGGWEGVYHHWDGYPSGLGCTLYHLVNEHFKGDIDAAIKMLIDDHRGGWSTINNADWSLEPGFNEFKPFKPGATPEEMVAELREKKRPQCYCHGERSEGPFPLVRKGEDSGGAEWLYVLDAERREMQVVERVYDGGQHATGFFGIDSGGGWKLKAVVKLDEAEPNWDKMDGYDEEEEEEEDGPADACSPVCRCPVICDCPEPSRFAHIEWDPKESK